MLGVASLRHGAIVLLQDEILDPDIGEGSAHHDFMVAPARAILIEIGPRNSPLDEILAGGRSLLDRARRRNMVGVYFVAEKRQNAGVLVILDRLGGHF